MRADLEAVAVTSDAAGLLILGRTANLNPEPVQAQFAFVADPRGAYSKLFVVPHAKAYWGDGLAETDAGDWTTGLDPAYGWTPGHRRQAR
jgi:hypothetical protein